MLRKFYILSMLLCIGAGHVFAQDKTDRDYLRSGNKLYNDSLFIKAEVDYRKALELNPKSTDAMFNLANALLMQQKAKEAMVQYESVSKIEKDKDGNVIVTRLNEQMCQEIAKAGNGMYIRVDNSNSAEKILNEEISKLAKEDVESQVFTDFDEQFQVLAWLVLILLVIEMLILERKNPLFKNVRLF